MPRYIDADKLCKEVETLKVQAEENIKNANSMSVRMIATTRLAERDNFSGLVCWIPTADVVPRAELDAMRGAANSYKMHYENARQEIERLKEYNTSVAFKHYFDGRKTAIVEIFRDIATEMGALLPLCATRLIGGRSIGKSFELGREKALRDVIECIAKVQKKYTEGAAADGK